jgi:hypothetical protein
MLDLPATKSVVMLTLATISSVGALSIYLASIRSALRTAQEKLHLHTWHLRSLVPSTIASRLQRAAP